MSDRPHAEDFDAIVHRALGDVTTAIRPDRDLASRLIANARSGGGAVVNLDARRRAARWVAPMLAAAVVAVLAVGGVTAVNLLADSDHKTAVEPTPLPTAPNPPVPVRSTEPAPSATPSPSDTTTPPPPGPTGWPHFRARSISFSDPDHGWALGDADCPTGNATDCASLLATSDGGQTWHRLGVPDGIVSTFDNTSCGTNGNYTGPCVNSVLLASDQVGYLWSLHQIFVTTNGGVTWAGRLRPADDWGGAIDMVVAGNSVVRITPLEPCSASCPGAVETAPIGTLDFTGTSVPSHQLGLFSSGLATHDDAVYLFAGGLDGKGLGILRSSDGGHTWKTVSSDPCGSSYLNGLSSTVGDDGALIADCTGTGVRVAPAGTTDFSETRDLPLPPDSDVGIAWAKSATDLMVTGSVVPLNTSGRPVTTCYHSDDGGRTWRPVGSVPNSPGIVVFVSSSVGYVVGNSGSYYLTRDGGLNWLQAPFTR